MGNLHILRQRKPLKLQQVYRTNWRLSAYIKWILCCVNEYLRCMRSQMCCHFFLFVSFMPETTEGHKRLIVHIWRTVQEKEKLLHFWRKQFSPAPCKMAFGKCKLLGSRKKTGIISSFWKMMELLGLWKGRTSVKRAED